jgi:hypothetical protein
MFSVDLIYFDSFDGRKEGRDPRKEQKFNFTLKYNDNNTSTVYFYAMLSHYLGVGANLVD